MIRIFIADEQPVVLAGLRSFLSGSEFQIVGEASSGLDLLQGVERTCPHIVLVDTAQTSFQGFSEGFCKHSRWAYKLFDYVPALKAASKRFLLEKLRKTAPKRIDSHGKTVTRPTTNRLTPRETDIIRLVVQGLCNKEIARTLGITVDTVKEHIQNILRKSGQSDRTQAALWAVRQEIVSL